MKMSIDWENKELHVTCEDIVDSGWFGFLFAKDNRDLIDAGWVVCYYPEPGDGEMPTEGSQLINSYGDAIGDILRKGQTPNHCNTCSCPPGGDV